MLSNINVSDDQLFAMIGRLIIERNHWQEQATEYARQVQELTSLLATVAAPGPSPAPDEEG